MMTEHELVTWRERLYRYGLSVCANGADADDAVQHALSGGVPELRRRDAVRAWMFAVVRNACRRMLRPTTTRDRLEHLLKIAEDVATPHEELERAERAAAVLSALEALEPEQQQILRLRDLEGLSGDETARRLGISTQAMKSRLHRARGALAALLEPRFRS